MSKEILKLNKKDSIKVTKLFPINMLLIRHVIVL